MLMLSLRSTFRGFQSGSLMAIELGKVSLAVMTDRHSKTRSLLFKPCRTVIWLLLLLLTGVEAWLVPQIRTIWLGAVSVGTS